MTAGQQVKAALEAIRERQEREFLISCQEAENFPGVVIVKAVLEEKYAN